MILLIDLSKKHEINDARKILNIGKQNVSASSYVVIDSLRAYDRAIRRELDNRMTAHIRTKIIKNEFTNRPIGRIHDGMREKLSVRHGLGMINLHRFCGSLIFITTMSDLSRV